MPPEELAKACYHLADGLNEREAAARVKICKTAFYQALKVKKIGSILGQYSAVQRMFSETDKSITFMW